MRLRVSFGARCASPGRTPSFQYKRRVRTRDAKRREVPKGADAEGRETPKGARRRRAQTPKGADAEGREAPNTARLTAERPVAAFRCPAFRAVWRLAPSGVSRRLAFRALWR